MREGADQRRPHPPAHPTGGVRSVLAVGAHPHDIELGCAGALAAHRAAGDAVTMLVLTGAEHEPGTHGDRRGQAEAAARSLDCLLVWGRFADHAVTADSTTIAAIENVISGVEADVVYGHAPDDAHPDHRAAAAATLAAARHSSRVLHYGSASTVRFQPSMYVDISSHLDRKLAALACHRDRESVTADPERVAADPERVAANPELVAAAARRFGAHARVRYAEAFIPARFVWDLAPVPRLWADPPAPTPVARVPAW